MWAQSRSSRPRRVLASRIRIDPEHDKTESAGYGSWPRGVTRPAAGRPRDYGDLARPGHCGGGGLGGRPRAAPYPAGRIAGRSACCGAGRPACAGQRRPDAAAHPGPGGPAARRGGRGRRAAQARPGLCGSAGSASARRERRGAHVARAASERRPPRGQPAFPQRGARGRPADDRGGTQRHAG